MSSCIFCDIVHERARCHKVWEDEQYLAFLSIFPNTEGFTVVIPKQHYSSYVFDHSESVVSGLMAACRKAARALERYYPDVGRVGVMFEGYGVDHLHAKLFPMHGTGATSEFKRIASANPVFFKQYEGFISSHDYVRADDDALAALAARIREAE